MSAAAVWPSGADPEWDPHTWMPLVATSLVAEFGDQFRALGPVWLRTDPRRLLWLTAPFSVLVVAAPSGLLRAVVALTVAAGVGLALQWQAAVEAHQHRCETFVDTLANHVASVLVAELPLLIVEEISMGQYRDGIEKPILHAATRSAEALRRATQGAGL